MNKREVRISLPMLYTGISQQAANVRLASQVQDATNIDFTVEHGATKRPYTKFVHKPSAAPTSGRDIRLHAIERDENERYLVLYGDGNLRVFQEMGVQPPVVVEGVVTTDSTSSTYLASGGADAKSIVLITVNDYTLAINTSVATGLLSSDSYEITASWPTYEIMTSQVPTEGTYHRTTGDSTESKAGYFKYSAGTQTFGTMLMPLMTLSTWKTSTGNWDETANNPWGFHVGFQRLAMSKSAVTIAGAGPNYTLTKVGAFTSYTKLLGDMIYVKSGTGITPVAAANVYPGGWATIVSRDSADQLTITPTGLLGLTACVDAVIDGIGAEYFVTANFDKAAGNTPADMYEVASKFQQGLRDAGCADGLIAWIPQKTGGQFLITSPYKGDDSVVKTVSQPDASIPNFLTDSGKPFYPTTATSTTGTGGNPTTTLDVISRWTRTYAPSQPQAKPDASKMPVQMVRNYKAVYPPISITGWTNTNPAEATTATAHGLTAGQTVVVAGATGGSPGSVNSTNLCTVTASNKFTIPVNLTGGAATGGTVYGKAGFTCSQITWNLRLSGNESTNAAPKPFRDSLTINDAIIVQDRLCFGMGQSLVFSQSNDLFNFYNDDYANIVDSDPIVAPLAATEVVTIKYLVPYRQSILVFTFNGQHFDFSWDQILSSTKIRSTPAIRCQTWSTRPVQVHDRIYFNAERGSYAEVNEYRYDDLSVQNVSQPVTTHVPTLVPLTIRSMCAVATEGTLLLLPDDSTKIYTYRWHFSGNAKDQSAWSKYAFDASYRITGMAAIRNTVYLLVQDASQYTIEAMVYEVPSDTF